jgi:hypothetical protein
VLIHFTLKGDPLPIYPSLLEALAAFAIAFAAGFLSALGLTKYIETLKQSSWKASP